MTHDEEVAWCKGLWDSINDGGSWLVPRSGMVFQVDKKLNRLILVKKIPHEEGMPCTAEELLAQQFEEVDMTRERFVQFGVDVVDHTSIPAISTPEMDVFLDSVAGEVSDT